MRPADVATMKSAGEQPGEPKSPEWNQVAPKAPGKRKRGGVRSKAAQLEVPPGAMPASRPPRRDGAK